MRYWNSISRLVRSRFLGTKNRHSPCSNHFFAAYFVHDAILLHPLLSPTQHVAVMFWHCLAVELLWCCISHCLYFGNELCTTGPRRNRFYRANCTHPPQRNADGSCQRSRCRQARLPRTVCYGSSHCGRFSVLCVVDL